MDELTRELRLRQQVLNVYNKPREDFDTKEEWDDYLETIEDIIYNLAYGIDVKATEEKLRGYERDNRANILLNQARKAQQSEAAMGVGMGNAATAGDEKPATAGPYVPSQSGPGVVVPKLARPYSHVVKGLLMPPASLPPGGCGGKEETAISAAAGWSPDLGRMRALKEAFGSMLLM